MKKTRLLFTGWICSLLLTALGCSNPLQRATPIPPAPSETPSPVPTATFTPSPTVSPTPVPTLTGGLQLIELHMLDEMVGWAWTSSPARTTLLMHTDDGGNTWADVTPPGSLHYDQEDDWAFFLDGRAAWLMIQGPSDDESVLLRTQDAGETWVSHSIEIDLDRFEFEDQNDGWGLSSEVQEESWLVRFYRTDDGGQTWTGMAVPAPPSYSEYAGDPEGFRGCDSCGDALYYDPAHVILLYSDETSTEGSLGVRLSVSLDQGVSWEDLELSLPDPLPPGGQVFSQWPAFVDRVNGFLSVRITNQAFPDEAAYDLLAIYVTTDGGWTWELVSTIDNPTNELLPKVEFVSTLDGFARCGNDLCATHDGAQTWRLVAVQAQFAPQGSGQPIFQFDFVSPQTGWVLAGSAGETEIETSLWMTNDGGLTWSGLAPAFIP